MNFPKQIIFVKSFNNVFTINGIIRILHGCEVRIENSISRVTIWHHEALLSDGKLILRDEIFYPQRTLMFDSFSCIPFDF